jgi:phosphoglucosamine mutase
VSRQYFGTDGIRSKAGVFPLDRPTVYALGRAAGTILGGAGARALLATDTRESCSWIAATLAAGLMESGAKCTYAGVLPTPALAHLCVRGKFTFGAMVSASHNPFDDNGIKFFSGRGYKLPDEEEHRIEAALDGLLPSAPGTPPAAHLGAPAAAFGESYVDWLASSWEGASLEGATVALDCANGAAHAVAPALFERLGARVVRRACEPDGRNINDGCGSLHAGSLARAVADGAADLGFAFDGDADRCLAVTPSGKVLDGDYVLYWEALRRLPLGRLPGRWVVGTVMSNLWLEQALAGAGVRFFRAPVGDRYVLQCLQDRGGVLGGEPSGHVLFLDRATTGDGLLTALAYARLARDAGGIEELARGIQPFPQVLVNLRVAQRLPLEEQPAIVRTLRDETSRLAGRGRIVLRYSGTEPLLRLMVEAQTEEEVEGVLGRLGEVLTAVLGEAPPTD